MRNILLFLLCTVSFAIKAQDITVDYQLSTSSFPDNYRPGIFAVPKTTPAINDFLNNGIQYNAIRTIDIELAMNHWSVNSINDVMSQLELQKPNILIANSRCDKLILPILKMPVWLSSSSDSSAAAPGWMVLNSVPPANYLMWNTLMDSIVGKINGQWGLDPFYEIWNEPDGDYWQASSADYFEFFRNTFFAIKSNHPNAKVGGPTVSNFTTAFSTSFSLGHLTNAQLDATIIGQVIDSCVTWGANLDFVSWHKFSVNLYAVDMEMAYLNQKLTASGHGIVPFIVSEWNLPFNEIETELDPAFMVNYTQCLEAYGVAGHAVAAWQDFETGATEFHNDYGLLSTGALHKPSWKALQLLNKMSGELLNVDVSDYRNLATLASYSNDTLRVLVSNFSRQGTVEAALSLFHDYDISADSLINNGYTPITIDSIMQGFIILTGSDPLTLAINAVIPTYQDYNDFYQNGRDVTLHFPGISGVHSGTKTIVDATNNNVIQQYDSLINAGHTRTTAVDYLFPNNTFDVQNVSLSDSTHSFHVTRNAVVLFEWHIPEISLAVEALQSFKNQFVVYPNPTSDWVNVILSEQEVQSIEIYDVFGKHIKTVQSTSFSMKECANGTYYLRVLFKNGSEVRQLVKF